MGKKPKGGKKSGKKSGKKGKKSKTPKDPELAAALNNANIWAAKVDIAKKSRNDYREACKKLAATNNTLCDTLDGSERTSIDIMIELKKEDLRKNTEIVHLENYLRHFNEIKEAEKLEISQKYTSEISVLENEQKIKQHEILLLQKELEKVKDFRRNRRKMESELVLFKKQLKTQALNHDLVVKNMEKKFQDEKTKLESEAASKISELAESAHQEAVSALDATTKQVYQDNVRLTDALEKHKTENTTLRQENCDLAKSAKTLISDIYENDKTVKSKILEAVSLKDKTKCLSGEIRQLAIQFDENLTLTKNDKHEQVDLYNKVIF